jgi:tetratricopeptide (TPR) repeat protein
MQANIHFLSGMDRCSQGKFEEAIMFFTKSLEIEPGHVASLYNRGLSLIKLNRFQEAIGDFDTALRHAPQDARVISEKAVALHLMGDNTQALLLFDEAQYLEPGNPYRYSSRAYVKAKMGKIHEAIADYKKTIELDPNDEVAYNNLGLLEEQLGYKELARQRFKTADRLTARQDEEFIRPALDELLDAHRKRKEKLQEDERAFREKARQEVPANRKMLWGDYFGVVKKVFTDRATFRDFLNFLGNGGKVK